MSEHIHELSDVEIQLLAKLAAKNLDGFLKQCVANFDHIKNIAGTAIAKAIIMASEKVIPDCEQELRTMLILSFRCSALARLLEHIRTDPELRQAMEHTDAGIDDVLARCMAHNTRLREAVSAGGPLPTVADLLREEEAR